METIVTKLERLEALLKEQKTSEEKPLSLPEAADFLGISRSTLYKFTSSGEIAHFKPSGKKIFFEKSDLLAWLHRNRRSSEAEIEQQALARLAGR